MEKKIIYLSMILFSLVFHVNCTGGGGNGDLPAGAVPDSAAAATDDNIISIDVGSTCSLKPNIPCVSVTICEPGTNNCQTIPRILLDTGSVGLRIFSSIVTIPLPSIRDSVSGATLAECMRYLDGTSHWGPIKVGDVGLGQLKAPGIPIQMLDASFENAPDDCPLPESDPDSAGYNGILGVGLDVEDCGLACANSPEIGLYFSCLSGTCLGARIPQEFQVKNPVAFLPTDNNGVILQFPTVPQSGLLSVQGSLILGIGTRSNNTIANVQTLKTNEIGRIETQFNGRILNDSFIDSGANILAFPSQIPQCSDAALAEFFCPPAPVSLSAIQIGHFGSAQVNVNFEIANAATLIASGNSAFSNLGFFYQPGFGWGLPFFFGRSVHVGITDRASPLGVGPYWAF